MAAADDVDSWVMACVPAAVSRSPYQADIVGMVSYGVVSGTQKRDVSEVLDLLALDDTPFINRIGWGPDSGGTVIEWMTEDLGPGRIENISDVASGAGMSLILNSIDGITGSDLIRQLHEGTVMYVFNSEDARHGMAVITSEPVLITTACTIHLSMLHLDTYMSAFTTTAADTGYYILGNVQNEGSRPGYARPRARALASNVFTILRQDVAITGSMKNTDMYAIGREDKHQILMRMKEMQRERERLALYSVYNARTSLMAGLMNGVFGFLTTQTGNNIDRSTRTLTETAVNTIVTRCWEAGGRDLTWFSSINQTAKFTRWDKNRIRMDQSERRGGGLITYYTTESGIEIELVPMANVPTNLAFVVDTSKVKLRAKRGRKAILEKLGKMGDFDDWQLISEFSMEMKGYNQWQHGMLTNLT